MRTGAITASSCPAEDAVARSKPSLRNCLHGVAPTCLAYRVAVLSVVGVVAVVAGIDLVQREARASARPSEFGYLRYNPVYWSEVAALSGAALTGSVVAAFVIIERVRQRRRTSRYGGGVGGVSGNSSGGGRGMQQLQLTSLGAAPSPQVPSSSASSLAVLMALAASQSFQADSSRT